MAMTGGSGGGNAGAIRAGGAVVTISTDLNPLTKGLNAAKQRLSSWGSSLAGVGARLAGAGVAALAPLAGMLKSGIDRAGALEDLQDQFGLTAEAVSKFGYAADVAGDGVESLEGVLRGLAKANTTGKPLDEFALDTAAALNAIEDPSERARAALDQLGRGGLSFLKMAGDLEDLFGESPLIDQGTLDSAEKFDQALTKIGLAISSALLPLVEPLAGVADGVSALVRDNADLALTAAGVAAGVVAAGAGLVALGAVAAGASAAFGVLVIAVKAAVAAVAFLVSPVGLALGAVAGLGYAFFTMTETGRGVASVIGDTLAGAFSFLKDTALTAWGGISAAVRSGDLVAAGRIAVAGLQAAWSQFGFFMTRVWNKVKDFAVDTWHDIGAEISKVGADVAAFVGRNFGKMFAQLADQAAKFARAFGLDDKALRAAARIGRADWDEAARRAKVDIDSQNVVGRLMRRDQREKDAQQAAIAAGFARLRLEGLAADARAGAEAANDGDGKKPPAEAAIAAARGSFSAFGGPGFFFGGAAGTAQKQLTEAQKANILLQEIRDKLDGDGARFS